MIEIVIVVLIAKQFYQLAKKYEQKLAWAYGILGVVSYYGGAFIAGVFIGLYGEIMGYYDILEGVNSFVLMLIFIPIGALSCWGTYQLLKKKWHKEFAEKERNKPRIDDIGRSEEEVKPQEDFLIGNRSLEDLAKKKDDGFRF